MKESEWIVTLFGIKNGITIAVSRPPNIILRFLQRVLTGTTWQKINKIK